MVTAHASDALEIGLDLRHRDLLNTSASQRAIFNSANFSSIATDAKGVIQVFNVGAERMFDAHRFVAEVRRVVAGRPLVS